jgi:hypothetical protein
VVSPESKSKSGPDDEDFRWRQEEIENPFLDVELGLVGDLVYFLLASHLNRDFREIADHALDVAADVALLQ